MIDFVRDAQHSFDASTSNTAEKDFQCKALIAVKFGTTAESNHFFLIEETAPGKIKTFDNLIGYTWKDMPVKAVKRLQTCLFQFGDIAFCTCLLGHIISCQEE